MKWKERNNSKSEDTGPRCSSKIKEKIRQENKALQR